MKQIFKDNALQSAFDEKGYVVVDLLEATGLEKLGAIYKSFFPENREGFFSSSYLNGFETKKSISDQTGAVLNKALDLVFTNYRSIGSAFLAKSPGPHSELPMHQDWTIVDEQNNYAINLWLPITPITPQNGTLCVLPGSHKYFPSLRAPTIPFAAIGLEDMIKSNLVSLHIKPGQAVALSQSLVHYSDANKSDKLRLAITTGVVTDDAGFEFHYWDKENNTLEKYVTNEPFLLQFDNFHQSIFQRPKFGKMVENTPFTFRPLQKNDLLRFGLTIETKEIKNLGILNKLLNAFKN